MLTLEDLVYFSIIIHDTKGWSKKKKEAISSYKPGSHNYANGLAVTKPQEVPGILFLHKYENKHCWWFMHNTGDKNIL